MKDQIKDIEMLREHIQNMELEANHLKTFQEKFMESEEDIKQLEKKLYNAENEKNQLLNLVQVNEDLKH